MTRLRSAAMLALVAVLATEATRAQAQPAVPRTTALPAPSATLPAEFTLVTSVREIADGRLLIADLSEKKLVVADWPKGSVTQLGRNGSGPGEYLQASRLLAIGGDSTILPDAQNGRWLMLSGATIVATVGAAAPGVRNGARLPLGADDRGNVILTKPITTSADPTVIPRRDSTLLVRVARATGREDTVMLLRSRATTITIQGPASSPTSVSVLINPLAAGEQAALFPDGWIAIARLEPYRVEWIAPNGSHTRGPPLPHERVRVDEGEKRAFVERQAARTGQPARELASFPEWPEWMPPFLNEALGRAPNGHLWIQRAPTAAQPNPPYDVVDRRGMLVARIASEKDVTVVGFGRNVVYTVITDDDGIQHLQRRPLP